MQQTTMALGATKMSGSNVSNGSVGMNSSRVTARSDVQEMSSVREAKTESSSGNFPLMKFRAGAVSVTVWNNKAHRPNGEEGEYMTVSCERSYTDKEGKWQSTNSLRTNDLPRAIVALQKAFEHIVLQEQDLFKGGN